ncbi:cupin domain-containing protein [Francisella sp. LA112445]|uniref:cupin domain-containing protein n=1 Tax=Francisella sp. LA112445 TaxID=1395624 RepID=UPI001788BE71|nr:cupin domain-containing protein [Francisella sp. LA112445]QIW10633.1 cupin domain-containing protein [Francisella sp. LA112445]
MSENSLHSSIYDIFPKSSNDEVFIDILNHRNVSIEKIISYGQVTDTNKPYIQDHDEWVLVLKGKTKLKLETKEYNLDEGEYLLIPKNTKHWVTYTANPTIWLAIHLKGK